MNPPLTDDELDRMVANATKYYVATSRDYHAPHLPSPSDLRQSIVRLVEEVKRLKRIIGGEA